MAKGSKLRDYFEAHVMEPSVGCRDWPFRSHHPKGYIKVAGVALHRRTCERWHGPPPFPRAQAAHQCGRPTCWAGEHLAWKTAKENSADRVMHGTLAVGERVGGAKLTVEQVVTIRARAAQGESQYVLAAEFGVSQGAITRVVNHKTWKWVDNG